MNIYGELYTKLQELGMCGEGKAIHQITLTALKTFEDWLEEQSEVRNKFATMLLHDEVFIARTKNS
jgi:hypothetical protein